MRSFDKISYLKLGFLVALLLVAALVVTVSAAQSYTFFANNEGLYSCPGPDPDRRAYPLDDAASKPSPLASHCRQDDGARDRHCPPNCGRGDAIRWESCSKPQDLT